MVGYKCTGFPSKVLRLIKKRLDVRKEGPMSLGKGQLLTLGAVWMTPVKGGEVGDNELVLGQGFGFIEFSGNSCQCLHVAIVNTEFCSYLLQLKSNLREDNRTS